MIRSNTSSKLNDQVNSTTFRSISGNFMTSYLNDQNEFNVIIFYIVSGRD